ncbi:hypothetical protein EW026_g4133 [Hermanssonia centrifuga]|uniref:Uncharacterized protein n=1 Tax=Hermanssonia centrifuga TaxID=98765 RepID=A0A4S4KMQ2_9APHY|nr:hypothetical protein EW026_g4133 [Hermanssonia centrifuga]
MDTAHTIHTIDVVHTISIIADHSGNTIRRFVQPSPWSASNSSPSVLSTMDTAHTIHTIHVFHTINIVDVVHPIDIIVEYHGQPCVVVVQYS